jgi:hypothetical protein
MSCYPAQVQLCLKLCSAGACNLHAIVCVELSRHSSRLGCAWRDCGRNQNRIGAEYDCMARSMFLYGVHWCVQPVLLFCSSVGSLGHEFTHGSCSICHRFTSFTL